jgi:excinuclease UvrABC nuclease subunit
MEEDNEHDFRQAAELRDRIAEAMWAQYQRVVLERGLEALDITEDEDENEDENEDEE